MRSHLLAYNGNNGTFDFTRNAAGNIATTDSEQYAVGTQLIEMVASSGVPGWAWDSVAGSGSPDTHGSKLYLIIEDTPAMRSLFASYALTALQPLVDAGRILNPAARVVGSHVTGRIDAVVDWQTPSGQADSISIPIGFP